MRYRVESKIWVLPLLTYEHKNQIGASLTYAEPVRAKPGPRALKYLYVIITHKEEDMVGGLRYFQYFAGFLSKL